MRHQLIGCCSGWLSCAEQRIDSNRKSPTAGAAMSIVPGNPKHTFFASLIVATVAMTGLGPVHADDRGPLHYLNIQTITAQTRPAFLTAMRNNAVQSRKEDANSVFDVGDVGGDDPTLVLFENWRDREGYDKHEKSVHVAPVIAMVPSAFAKPERKYLLEDVPGLPAPARQPIKDPSATYNVVNRLNIEPALREAFVDAIGKLLERSRKRAGNLVFDVYQGRDNADAFVVYERWRNASAYAAQASSAEVTEFTAALKSMVAEQPEILTLHDRIID
ncbi:putative quinol monooxygenase [Pseudomonas syringae]|uniref:putative quinol monooxygenase n=1 Tax=Pseudomonas syringae TaxID=317 RepID=UPI001F4A0460|nr:antibiotic biosynthesis monooxygenase [Pseudomonas syringae]